MLIAKYFSGRRRLWFQATPCSLRIFLLTGFVILLSIRAWFVLILLRKVLGMESAFEPWEGSRTLCCKCCWF